MFHEVPALGLIFALFFAGITGRYGKEITRELI